MDVKLFTNLMSNLLETNAICINDMQKDFINFENTYCFNPILQPMFTTNALTYLFDSAKNNCIYEVVDPLDIAITFFIIEKNSFIIGPYTKAPFSEEKIESILIKNSFPASTALSLNLYYTNLPIIYTDYIRRVITSCLLSILPEHSQPDFRRLSGFISEKISDDEDVSPNSRNFSEIYSRYDAEKRFLNMIKNGDVENVMYAFEQMSSNGKPGNALKSVDNHYNNATYFAILRALSRKAAEESGLSVITIDAITQKYVQIIASSSSAGLQSKYLAEMILELTRAVRNYKLSYGSYSLGIQKAIEYMNLHLDKEIRLEDIASFTNMSVSHLSRIFKSETNETIINHLCKIRCQKAARLLKETGLPISEIASFVGYTDNNYFVKVFKKIYEMTPSEYRKKPQ